MTTGRYAVTLRNQGTELNPKWRVLVGDVVVGGRAPREHLLPYYEELLADPAKAEAVRAAFVAQEGRASTSANPHVAWAQGGAK